MTSRSRFRVTTWPGAPVPVPPVVHAASIGLRHDGWLQFEPPWSEAPIPDELFVRELLDLEVDDDDAVVDFLRMYGVITVVPEHMLIWTVDTPTPRPGEHAIHVGEIRLYLQVARALVKHWRAYSAKKNPMKGWAAEGFDKVSLALGQHVWSTPAEAKQLAWTFFEAHMNSALRGYHARVEVSWLGGSPGTWTGYGQPTLGLYGALCLQLLNVVAEELPVQTCANETCGRSFVRQQGRAEYGQYRTKGVLYCSPQCAHMQAQREYRRRNRKGNQ